MVTRTPHIERGAKRTFARWLGALTDEGCLGFEPYWLFIIPVPIVILLEMYRGCGM